ncbi:unnamed protein product [Peniophora sp. CBMAI 1063]|nr:unnamed protein product [Peniophora sp. CBMAI 1063]
MVLTIDPVASVAHLDERARELAALIPVRKYVALSKDYHDEPTDSLHPTVNHKVLLLSNTASGVRIEESLDLPWSNRHLEPEAVDVRVRVAERDYTDVRRVSPQELARVNKACLKHAQTKQRALRERRTESASSASGSYWTLEFETRSISTMPTSRGAVENESLINDNGPICANAEAGPSQPNARDSFLYMTGDEDEDGPTRPDRRDSFLHMTDDGEGGLIRPHRRDSFLCMTDSDDEDENEEDWLSLSDHPSDSDSDSAPSLIGSTSSSSRSPSPTSSVTTPRDLYGAPIDTSLKPFCTLEYEAYLRRTRAPVVDVWYDLSDVEAVEDPERFRSECAALAGIMQDAEMRLGRNASFAFDCASSRETLEEQARAMIHPENSEWEGWPLAPRPAESVMHSELDSGAARRGNESFLIMRPEREKRYRGRCLVADVQRLRTELGWKCSSVLRAVRQGPSRREMRLLQQGLCGPFD